MWVKENQRNGVFSDFLSFCISSVHQGEPTSPEVVNTWKVSAFNVIKWKWACVCVVNAKLHECVCVWNVCIFHTMLMVAIPHHAASFFILLQWGEAGTTFWGARPTELASLFGTVYMMALTASWVRVRMTTTVSLVSQPHCCDAEIMLLMRQLNNSLCAARSTMKILSIRDASTLQPTLSGCVSSSAPFRD